VSSGAGVTNDVLAQTEAPTGTGHHRLRWVMVPIGLFLLSRIADAIMLMIAVRQQFPASMLPGGGVPIVRDPHTYSNVVQSWDGQWFRLIAEQGYPGTVPSTHGHVIASQWGFYPLFPALVRVVMVVTHTSFGVAASILNLALGSAGMCVLYRMISSRASRFTAVMTVVVASTFPAAVIFQLAYSETLCFLLLVSGIWFLSRRRYSGVIVVGVLLSLTRPIVLPLALVVSVHGLLRWHARAREPFPVRDRVWVAVTTVVVAASFGLWSLIGWGVTGDPHAYVTAIGAWSRDSGRTVSVGSESWLTHAIAGDRAALGAVLLGVGFQCFFLFRRPARLWSPELRAWSLSYGAYLLLTTWPESGVTRHLIMAIVPWWPWPEVGDQVTDPRRQILMVAAVGVVGLALQFFWIRLCWINGPAFYSYP
jgi:hypothetical protein